MAEVIASSGDRTIHAATIRYTAKTVDPMPSEEFVQQVANDGRETYARALANTEDDDSRRRLQKHLDNIEHNVRAQLMANARAPLDVFYAMSGPALGGDRYLEITRHPEGRPPETVEVSYRALGAGGYLSLRNERRHSTVLIEDRPMYYGTEEPHRLGRLMGALTEVFGESASLPKAFAETQGSITLKDGGTFQGQEALCVNVTFAATDGSGESFGSSTFTTIPAMGYVVPLIRDLSSSGTLLAEVESSDYVRVLQAKGDPLWFPMVVKLNQFSHEGAPLRSTQYQFDSGAISLNDPPPEDRFRISLNPQMTVADTRTVPAVSYSVREPMSLGLDNLDSLRANPALEPVVIHSRLDTPAQMPGWRWPGRLVLNLAIVAVLAGLLWWRSRRAAALLLLVAFALPGCGPTPGGGVDGAGADASAGLIITPELIDFGTVSSSSAVHQQVIQIQNLGTASRRISIDASCGCLAVAPTKLDLPAGESATATVSLSPDSRAGMRQSQITVTSWDNVDAGFASQDDRQIIRPIAATVTIVNEWHATPRRVVVATGPSGGAGVVTITAPRHDWSRATVSTIGGGFVYHEMNRSAAHEEAAESRTFRLDIENKQSGSRGLTFTLQGQDSPVLVVPIVASPEQSKAP